MADQLDDIHVESEHKFVWWLCAIVLVLAALPALIGLFSAPAGSSYVGYQYNTDDHMVYAAWMRQAMDGHFFFDNRFTTQAQPGLTVHLYFFALGLVAKITGIATATTLARLGFSAFFIWLLYRLVRRLDWEVYEAKLAVALAVVGGGIGGFVWHKFGQEGPVDIWQPEGFVFPSMLTNSLFMVSLCLILIAFQSFLNARKKPKAMIPGALSLALLMNIHSYDVLLVALVMVGFLAACLAKKLVTKAWFLRSLVIACGAIPPALWFVYVLRNDTVFQSRAATETYSPNFNQVALGYALLIVFGLCGAVARAGKKNPVRLAGVGLAAVLFITLLVLAPGHKEGYFLTPLGFGIAFAVALTAVVLAADESPTWNLLFSWAVIGTIAIYFPGLFQRKLTMGLSIPWAVLTAYGVCFLLRARERSARNLVMALAIVLLGVTSIQWLLREITFIRSNVANTGRHPVYLTKNVQEIIDYLNKEPGKKVVLAIPGAASPAADPETGQAIPDELLSPMLPDIAPFCSGLAGAYTYAGHWSETPDYGAKCGDLYRYFLRDPFQGIHQVMTDEERLAFAKSNGANFAILPVQESYPEWPFISAASIGEIVVEGPQFELVKLRG